MATQRNVSPHHVRRRQGRLDPTSIKATRTWNVAAPAIVAETTTVAHAASAALTAATAIRQTDALTAVIARPRVAWMTESLTLIAEIDRISIALIVETDSHNEMTTATGQ